LQQIADGGRAEIERIFAEDVTNNLDGTYTVDLGDFTYTFSAESPDQAKTAFQQMVNNLFGVDTEVAQTITRGITDALPTIISGLSEVDAGPLTNVASALSNIYTSLSNISELDYERILGALSGADLSAVNVEAGINN